jgi:hypothetical protein
VSTTTPNTSAPSTWTKHPWRAGRGAGIPGGKDEEFK